MFMTKQTNGKTKTTKKIFILLNSKIKNQNTENNVTEPEKLAEEIRDIMLKKKITEEEMMKKVKKLIIKIKIK